MIESLLSGHDYIISCRKRYSLYLSRIYSLKTCTLCNSSTKLVRMFSIFSENANITHIIILLIHSESMNVPRISHLQKILKGKISKIFSLLVFFMTLVSQNNTTKMSLSAQELLVVGSNLTDTQKKESKKSKALSWQQFCSPSQKRTSKK